MNLDKDLENLKKGICLSERSLRLVCEYLKDILVEESNVVQLSSPVVICGDIHGQFYDLLELMNKGGPLPDTQYLFLGDYVDRGYHSLETLQFLICLKIKFPNRIYLLRGNHESRSTSLTYGFYDEVNVKYGSTNAWKFCTDAFDYFPIGAVVDDKIFCIHGGLSPEIRTIDQIRLIDRKIDIPIVGPFSDLMWSDPDDIEGWIMNQRGAGFLFGVQVVTDFNRINGIEMIARAHQLVQDGYQYWFKVCLALQGKTRYCLECPQLPLQVRERGLRPKDRSESRKGVRNFPGRPEELRKPA